MGMTRFQILARVSIPLALPVLLAGLRYRHGADDRPRGRRGADRRRRPRQLRLPRPRPDERPIWSCSARSRRSSWRWSPTPACAFSRCSSREPKRNDRLRARRPSSMTAASPSTMFRWSSRAGEFCAFVGPSGAGKSTLLRMVNCLVRPDRGLIAVRRRGRHQDRSGRAPPPLRLRHPVDRPLPALDGRREYRHRPAPPALAAEADRRARRRAARPAGARPARPSATAIPHQLSGGQQQRVGVARALAAEPSLRCSWTSRSARSTP